MPLHACLPSSPSLSIQTTPCPSTLQEVVRNQSMHIADRVAFLLRFQRDDSLLMAQLEELTREIVQRGSLHGLVLTGLSDGPCVRVCVCLFRVCVCVCFVCVCACASFPPPQRLAHVLLTLVFPRPPTWREQTALSCCSTTWTGHTTCRQRCLCRPTASASSRTRTSTPSTTTSQTGALRTGAWHAGAFLEA